MRSAMGLEFSEGERGMTSEEAKTVLINSKTFIKDCFKYMKDEHVEQFKEAYRTAIKALEKQIPKKPIINNCGCMSRNVWYLDRPCCPRCGEHAAGYKYCDYCGQALDRGKGK